MLQDLAVPDLANLMSGARYVRLARGDHLTLRGSVSGQCWFLLTGYVKEHRPHNDGSEALQGFRGPGDLVGEVSALTAEPSDHDTTAMGHGEALAFGVDHVQAAVAASPALQRAMLRTLADRATAAEAALARNTICGTSERVALAIIELAERWGVATASGVHLGIPLTQSELGEWVGASRETTAKALHRLRGAGVVATSRRHLAVHDMAGLRRAAGLVPDNAMDLPA